MACNQAGQRRPPPDARSARGRGREPLVWTPSLRVSVLILFRVLRPLRVNIPFARSRSSTGDVRDGALCVHSAGSALELPPRGVTVDGFVVPRRPISVIVSLTSEAPAIWEMINVETR